MNVVIKINGREAIPVRALPLLCEWGTMHPQKLAGALGRVTDDERRSLFENLHDMNAYHVEDGRVHPVEAHHWRDHIYRNLQALSDTIRHTEITHEIGHSEWRVKALQILPKDAFVWRDEYEQIYDQTYGIGSRTRESGDSHNPPVMSKSKPPRALNFNPFVEEDMQPPVQAALDAIGRATGTASKTTNDVAVNTHKHHSSDENAIQQVEELPLAQEQKAAAPAPLPLTTLDIANCFKGIYWNEDKWKTNLGKRGKNPGWLGEDSIAIPGKQGGNEIHWYPVCIGAALVAKQGVKPHSIRARFQTNRLLAEWRDAWENYESEYLTTE